MNAVGIDISKGKSTVAALRPMGEVTITPCEFSHTELDLERMVFLIMSLCGETRVVMEATGRYYEPIAALPSHLPSTKMLVREAVRVLSEIDATLTSILTRMEELPKDLPEYQVAIAMPGIGSVLALRLIAEVGDVRRFHTANALIAYAGLDSPPHQSGLLAKNRGVKKREPSTEKDQL